MCKNVCKILPPCHRTMAVFWPRAAKCLAFGQIAIHCISTKKLLRKIDRWTTVFILKYSVSHGDHLKDNHWLGTTVVAVWIRDFLLIVKLMNGVINAIWSICELG